LTIGFLQVNLGVTKYLAKANDVADFANSEGWIVKLPIAYQHLCPEMVFQTETIPLTIIGNHKMILAYFHKISVYTQNNKINGMVNNMKTNCFWYVSSTEDSEEEYMFSQPIITNAIDHNTCPVKVFLYALVFI
jgi:hypothetical protein